MKKDFGRSCFQTEIASLALAMTSKEYVAALIFHPPDALDSASSPTFIVLPEFFLRATSNQQRATSLWRTQLQPIRTSAEITAHIRILPARQAYLYRKLSRKATQLRLLGMPYGEIAKSLNINKKTATKACEYQGR